MQPADCSQFLSGTPDHTRCEGTAKLKTLHEAREAAKKQEVETAVSETKKLLEANLSSFNKTYNELKGNFSSLESNHTALQTNHTNLKTTLKDSQNTCKKILETLGVQEAGATCQDKSEVIFNLFHNVLNATKETAHNASFTLGFNECLAIALQDN